MDCTNKNCPAYAKCLAPYRGSRCKATRATYGLGDPLTNYDRIRAMTDEELAEFITNTDFCELLCFGESICKDGRCDKKMLDWLKQEAES